MNAVESAAGDLSVRSADVTAGRALMDAQNPGRVPVMILFGAAVNPSRSWCSSTGYAFVALIETCGDLAAVDGVLRRGFGVVAARFIGVLVVAVALHSMWDSVHAIPAHIALPVISLGLLVRTTHQLSQDHSLQQRSNPAGASSRS